MSFILEALKKSEERRRLLDASRQPRPRILDMSLAGSRRWPTWLFLGLLLAALAGGWWLRGASQPATVESPVITAPTPLPTIPTAAPALPQITPVTTTASAPPLREAARPAPSAPVPTASSGETARPARGKPAVAQSVSPPPAGVSPPAGPRPVSREIPPAVRDRVPGLTMSLHFYADEPARRMVRIDDRIMREGQTVAENLVLEEITPSGAIFSFAGERFEVRGPGGER
jgi:general secretion pathway protein B